MSWCDIGVNFIDSRLEVEPVIARSLEAEVNQIIITGTSVNVSKAAIDLAQSSPKHLFSTVGVHPHHASEFNAQTQNTLRKLAVSSQVVAIGECGLDYNRNFSTPAEQIYAFEQQLELACELKLPVFLHERDAFDEQLNLLKKYQNQLMGGVAHCFTGTIEQMQAYLDLGLFIGITGWVCDPKRGEALRAAVKALPIERLLLETDAPYLRPKGLANNRKVDKGNNEPAYLPYIAEHVANIMQLDLLTVRNASMNNSQMLFALPSNEAKNA
ncbi:TatD family hydrolase [Paraglaciecola aquimarina]|uniref:TatD family hydrolase n=1 Tax=Paraglaciecola aquimarina TaxID=1235557 RepID=A0ABU3SSG5_9ALTE|nr:TatD family hydrolase [Paraglaciecola aquimarina]MDU0352955.1 TatD family hydrolase [Paraglaciecola aquimarina]